MVRLTHFLIAIALVFSIVLPGCAEEQEFSAESLRDRFVEILQPTNEQLEQLEAGTGTLQLREDQVDTLSDYVTQLLDDLQPRLEQAQWQEVKDILEGTLIQGEVDLENVGPVTEAIRDSLISEVEANTGVYTNLVRLSTASTAGMEEQTQLTEGSQRSTCVTLYTPRNRYHGDKHYEYGGKEQEDTVGWRSESSAAADSYSGAIGVDVYADIGGGAGAYAVQRILINVPVDATDIDITARLLYGNGAFSLWPCPVGCAETGIMFVPPYQLHQTGDVIEQERDPKYGWDDALKWALTILTLGFSLPVQSVAFGLSMAWAGLDGMAYLSALEEYGEARTIGYSTASLPAGDYIFEIGVYARVESYLGIAKAHVIGMVRDIEVSMNVPSLTLDIASTEGGYVIEPGEGAFPCCPGEEVDIVAVSYQGYRFTGWTGDVDTIDRADIQSTYITMNGDYSITANFEAVQCDLAVSSTSGGSVTTPGEGTFPCPYGTTEDLVAEAEEGYYFSHWSGDIDFIANINDPTTTILMLEDYSITANFEEIPQGQFDLTISSTTGGSVATPGEGTFPYDSGTVVDLVAVAEDDYYFANWSGDVDTIADINDPTTTITMIEDCSVIANFEAEEIVTFPDPNLKAAIREAIGKPTGDIYASDLEGLTELEADYRNIADLTGLEHCTSLSYLDLVYNQISNISPLANLTNLTELYLHDNQISNISPLANLTNLTKLALFYNQISDISPLANLTSLTDLGLDYNQISDISPLANLTSLIYLGLMYNQISNISPLTNLSNLTHLYPSYNQISNISPLANLTSLTSLSLNGNQISDISPLANLTNLTHLSLDRNQISNISPLTNLTNLTGLYLGYNGISDISPLANLTNLRYLHLRDNEISDISPLVQNEGVDTGDVVNLRYNPLSDDSINIYIPQLEARGVTVYYRY